MIYLPPGRVRDFARSSNEDRLSQAWHELVKGQIDSYRGLERFLDPLDADDTAIREVISWTGFPRILDAWLNIDGSSNLAERNRRKDRAHRSAEILNRFIYVKLRNNGKFYVSRVAADPANPFLLYPEATGGTPILEDGFSLAERPQDEYLEWFLVRDPDTNQIKRIDFTVEAPEYWEVLAERDPDLVKTIYSELLGDSVPKEDLFFLKDTLCPEVEEIAGGAIRLVGYTKLFPDDDDFKAGQYNRWNKWNTDKGMVHLTQSANTLFAEINLAAIATKRFESRPNLDVNVDRFTLTACGGYGATNRNSDPTIGQAVNSLALSNYRVMVSNPIGLYIGEINLDGFQDPQGNPVSRDEILTIHRGSFNDEDGLARVLRFSVHPPAGATYGLEACTFDGFPLLTGGPIARKTTVIIHGIAMPADGSNPLSSCRAKACSHPTKEPKYYISVLPSEACPDRTDPIWNDDNAPVTIAPELSRLMPITGSPRSGGGRIA
jgi:hypothetical protein